MTKTSPEIPLSQAPETIQVDLVEPIDPVAKSPSTASLGLFAVLPAYQSKGIGKALVKAALDHMKDVWKCETCNLRVLERRPELQAWYEKLGFVWEGQATVEFVKPELLKVPNVRFVIMVKTL